MLIKRGDAQILSIIEDEDELTEEQKQTSKVLASRAGKAIAKPVVAKKEEKSN